MFEDANLVTTYGDRNGNTRNDTETGPHDPICQVVLCQGSRPIALNHEGALKGLGVEKAEAGTSGCQACLDARRSEPG